MIRVRRTLTVAVRRGVALSALSAICVACTYDWDAFDPRLGGASSGGSGAVSGSTGLDASIGGVGGAGDSSAGASGFGGTGGTSDGASGGGVSGTGAVGGVSGSTGSGGATGSGGTSAAGGTGGASGAGTGGSGGAGGAVASGGSAGSGGSTSSGGSAGSGGSTSNGGSAGSGGSGVDAGPGTTSYPAAVADCVNPMAPNPDTCESLTGVGEMNVDLADTPNNPHHAFLRFNLDGAFAGRTVTSVRLRLHTTADPNAGSPSSGEVWSVATFARADLFTAAPAKVGAVPIAGDIGAVTRLQVVEFVLPVGSVTANSPACFGVFALLTEGVDYYNNRGAEPPQLIVGYQ